MNSLRDRLKLLAETRDKQYIPPRDRGYFWTTFKKLKAEGVPYDKAWDWTVWSLEHHYGLCP